MSTLKAWKVCLFLINAVLLVVLSTKANPALAGIWEQEYLLVTARPPGMIIDTARSALSVTLTARPLSQSRLAQSFPPKKNQPDQAVLVVTRTPEKTDSDTHLEETVDEVKMKEKNYFSFTVPLKASLSSDDPMDTWKWLLTAVSRQEAITQLVDHAIEVHSSSSSGGDDSPAPGKVISNTETGLELTWLGDHEVVNTPDDIEVPDEKSIEMLDEKPIKIPEIIALFQGGKEYTIVRIPYSYAYIRSSNRPTDYWLIPKKSYLWMAVNSSGIPQAMCLTIHKVNNALFTMQVQSVIAALWFSRQETMPAESSTDPSDGATELQLGNEVTGSNAVNLINKNNIVTAEDEELVVSSTGSASKEQLKVMAATMSMSTSNK